MDEGKRLFKRIVQSSADLYHAAECANQILQRDLHPAIADEDQRLLRCLNTALIVSYARPFSKNRKSHDVRENLPADFLKVLSDEQRQLHNRLVDSRNRDHAHSDPRGMDMTVRVQEIAPSVSMAEPFSRDGSAPWPRESIEKIAELIDCLQAKLCEEQISIQETLQDGDQF